VLGALVAGFVLLFFDLRFPHPSFVGEDLGREAVYEGVAWVLAVAAVLQVAAAMLGARLARSSAPRN
jgi:hypothetical protein